MPSCRRSAHIAGLTIIVYGEFRTRCTLTYNHPGDLENIRDLRSDQILGDKVPSSLFLVQHTYAMRCCQITRVQIRVNVPSMKYTRLPF
jgi:hypothetical protein